MRHHSLWERLLMKNQNDNLFTFSHSLRITSSTFRLRGWANEIRVQAERTARFKPMYFGVDYYPEQWVFPYGGTADNPEAQWEQDAELMVKAGVNVVRM